jgi:tetratricopeptide (TPR) repeat protein
MTDGAPPADPGEAGEPPLGDATSPADSIPRFYADPEWEEGIRAVFADERTHEQARAIVRAFCEEGAPFALYLRAFQEEAYDFPLPASERDPKDRLIGYAGGTSRSTLETKLASAFDGHVAAITAYNPSNLVLSNLGFPRLELDSESWEGEIDWLMQAASFIVFELDVLAPGVFLELELLASHRREDSTVVVLPAKDAEQTLVDLIYSLHARMGAVVPDYETPDEEHPAIQRFARVVREDELPSDVLRSPLFADLVAAHHARRGLSDPASLVERGHLVNAWGALRLAAEETDEAQESFVAALRLFNDAHDDRGLAAVLMNVGHMYLEVGQHDDAISAFRDSGTVSKRANDEAGFRQAVAWVGLSHYLAGDPETAAHYLLKAVELERDAGETGSLTLIEALDGLRRIYEDSGDLESAQNCALDLEEAFQAHEDGS